MEIGMGHMVVVQGRTKLPAPATPPAALPRRRRRALRSAPSLAELCRVPAFAGATIKELKAVARHADVAAVAAGTVVASPGSRARQLVLVASGELTVLRPGAPAGHLTAGAVVGAEEIAGDRPFDATVVAERPAVLVAVPRRELSALASKSPSVARLLNPPRTIVLEPRAETANAAC